MPGPTKEQRLHVLKRQVAHIENRLVEKRQRSERWSLARLVSFLAAVFLSSVALFAVGSWLFWVVLVLFGTIFALIIYIHRQLEESITRHGLWQRLQKRQIARMQLDWGEIPTANDSLPQFSHPFEIDFDLIGQRSLHRLIDIAVTSDGSSLLRAWLSTTDPKKTLVEGRQQLVRELVPLSLFRTRLFLAGHRVLDHASSGSTNNQSQESQQEPQRWEPQKMLSWFSERTELVLLQRWMWFLGALAIVNWGLLALDFGFDGGRLWPYPLALYAILTFYANSSAIKQSGGSDLFTEAARLHGALQYLRQLFHLLESYSFRSAPTIKELCKPFTTPGERPSLYVRRLAWVANATGMRGNPFIWMLLNLSLPWDILFAYQLEKCRRDIGNRMPVWFGIWFELEALSSLANLAYINPNYTFPEFIATTETTVNTMAADLLLVEGIGHPLLPDVDTNEPKVRNDFRIKELGQIGIITGSNMAGKSTFLRSLGMNLALAFAGGPADANSFRTVPLRLFASIKVSDSVTDGVSYFYAEVQRLSALLKELDDATDLPLFFCIDEIFRGTNNRERLAGSQAYIQALAGKNGSGLISTHDLELVKLADQSPLIGNYHFRDDIVDDKMAFDYQLRTGPCPTTNALKIMELAGLPVPDEK